MTLALSLAACGKKPDKTPRTPEVGFIVARQTSSAQMVELAGRASAYQQSDVRPQVSGVIRRRLFTEGALVRQGQPLFEIDPSLYRASVAQAEANLASARANAEATTQQANRLKPLAEIEAVARQDYINAAAAARQARAAVAQGQAQVETARINLRYTTVPAPISGRVGRSLFTVGALVTANQADPLAQISQPDPIYIDMQQSAADMLALRRALGQQGALPASADVRLTLEDGSAYGPAGRIQFSEAIVDPQTGSVTLRARFPNPQGVLLPGMFVRARFAQLVDRTAFLIPQPAVGRDPQGRATVAIVGADGKIAVRTVTADRTDGPNWVVTGGLKGGEHIVVQGGGQLKPGQKVKAVPASQPEHVGPPKGGGDGASH